MIDDAQSMTISLGRIAHLDIQATIESQVILWGKGKEKKRKAVKILE